jgi:PAS domain S-box-containing protein
MDGHVDGLLWRLVRGMAIPNSSDILQAVIEATPDAIFVKDLDGRYILINEAAARFLGKSPAEIVGKNDLELYPSDTAQRFIEEDRAVLASGAARAFEGVARGETGTQAYLVTKGVYRDRNGQILGVFGISHDVTELRSAREELDQAREALFRSQKLEAVGQLTGGVAHDFNNILAIILGNVELLKLTLPRDPHVIQVIDTMTRATLHGRDLTSQLLAFSRRRLLNPRAVDMGGLVSDTVRLLGRTLGVTIQISTDTGTDAVVAMVDPAAFEAAVLNVALNARDAMPNGGILSIRMTRVDIEPSKASEDLPAGAYARLEIADTGTGMSPDIASKAFEPFFTTKTGGRGSGLGLSMVYGFAKQSGGTVTLTSRSGEGTTVTMFIPLAVEAARPIHRWDSTPALPASIRSILLVEDDVDVRQSVHRQLKALGHEALAAGTAAEAIAHFKSASPPDLLLTDVELAIGMNGIDLAVALRATKPELPVVFMSGYTAAPEAQERIREFGAPFLAKPFTASQLASAVAQACTARGWVA